MPKVGNLCMTGVVTESVEDLYEMSPISLMELPSVLPPVYKGPGIISFGELMESLGVPKAAYGRASMRLSNGHKVPMTDPQLGWGPNGFGYYLTTFIRTAV